MPDKDLRSHLLQAATLTQNRTFNRRELEWKLSFSLWTGIILFSAAFFTEEAANFFDEDNGSDGQKAAIILQFLSRVYPVVFSVAAVVQVLVQCAHYRDSKRYFRYMEKAFPRLSNVATNMGHESCCWKDIWKVWKCKVWNNIAWGAAHVGITAFLLWGSCKAITIAIG
ncbi:MAG: hypothetical protein WD049_09000 [Candidatus Paceibacterota bacterium]